VNVPFPRNSPSEPPSIPASELELVPASLPILVAPSVPVLVLASVPCCVPALLLELELQAATTEVTTAESRPLRRAMFMG
jgi:hypothetical protein